MRKLVSMKSLLLFVFTFLGVTTLADSPAVESVEKCRPMYEKFGMTSTQLFALMVGFTILLVVVLVSVSLNSGKIVHLRKKKGNGNLKKFILLIGTFAATSNTFAKDAYEQMEIRVPFPDESFWLLLSFDIILVLMILYMTGLMNKVLYTIAPKPESNFWKRFQKTITDARLIEDEDSILMDHDYDGIKELDNNLPPWWKWGFYITIVWGIVYFIYYMIPGGGLSQEEEFLASWEQGEIEVAEYKAAHPELVTEESAQFLTDASTISQGKSIYVENCQVCHMEGGAGGAGPNLTDDYWLYGPDMKSMFTTISEGANNGMRAWKDQLNGIQIQAVASYIFSLEPLLPPVGQDPKGDHYPPEE